ncbi:tripartite tricarboxylate transporter TctB family protein [uncultured Jannaschia sp.]|uniref:tripartite tricarboxylate transporter TctB family protein n=1 Tax=uncultured Jannaschia sp. TaxID=293347 RepID=UPI00263314C8|nr:tripartite tricarboxylate transporter TctB family protein [uncultured Jannaschia sp.]
MDCEADAATPTLDRSTLFAGAVVTLLGAYVLWQSLGMQLGTPSRMGPGYYPMLLGGTLILLGALICVLEARRAPEADDTLTERGVPVWRSRVFVPLAMVVFALLLRPAGLVPACVGLVGIASLAAPSLSLRRTMTLIVVTPALIWGIFVFGLGLPLQAVEGL